MVIADAEENSQVGLRTIHFRKTNEKKLWEEEKWGSHSHC